MDRYVYKEIRRSFLAICIELTISNQQVFIWLQVLHRNSRDWREFQWEPSNRGTGQSPKLAPGGLPNPAEMRLGFANPNRATGEAGGLSDINGSDAKHGNEIRR